MAKDICLTATLIHGDLAKFLQKELHNCQISDGLERLICRYLELDSN